MELEAKKFKTFLERINMNNLITECIVNVTSSGLECVQMSSDNVSMVKAKLKNKAMKKSGDIESFGIQNLPQLISVVDRFKNDDMKIVVKGNMLNMSSKNIKASLILPDVDFITSTSKIPDFSKYKNKFNLEIKYIQDAFDDLLVLISKVEFKKIKFIGKPGKLIIRAGDKESIERTIKIPEITEAFESEYGDNLRSCIGKLHEVVSITTQSDYPIIIEQKQENMDVLYLTAPFVEPEEDEEEEKPKDTKVED